jgi:hypothetical protein
MLDKEERAFWSAAWEQWKVRLGGAGSIILLGLYERFVQPIPWQSYAVVLALLGLEAAYLVWRDEYRRSLGGVGKPLAARVEMRGTHMTSSEQIGPQLTWQFRVVNREDVPLLLRADFHIVTNKDTYKWYSVCLDGLPDNEPVEIPARGSKTIVASITQRFKDKIPEFLKDRVKYPEPHEKFVRHEMVLYDIQSRRRILFDDKTPYDWPEPTS